MSYFSDLEHAKLNHAEPLEVLLKHIKTDDNGLIAAIAQEVETNEILMLAWMNMTALRETIDTGYACYYSRSRKRLWRKGETSGQRQKVLSMALDCDGDAVILHVEPGNVACHTGRKSCFYHIIENGQHRIGSEPEMDPVELYKNT